jgi:hypothetical protein
MSQAAAPPPDSFVESDHEFFELTGPMPTAWDDHRRFPRFYFRSCAEANIYPLRREKAATTQPCFVLTRDLSRGGMSLIHSEQLFPGQRLEVILNCETPRLMEVVWCRRWTHGRYCVGCRFISASGKPEGENANGEA